MKRINGIDTIRGIAMWLMMAGHIMDWWIKPEYYWHRMDCYAILEPICSTGFLFASGISAALSYKTSMSRIDQNKIFNVLRVRNEYMFRAIFILIVAFFYNFFVALFYGGIPSLWSWYVLQTIGFCLILVYPLLNISIYFRLIFGFSLLAMNPLIYELLSPFQGQTTVFGYTYYFLYNPVDQYPILSYFSIFLIGTVLGDILFNLNKINDQSERKTKFKKYFIIPSLISGGFLIVFGVLYKFPDFLRMRSLSSFLYSLGIILSLLSVFITIQEFKLITTKKSYKFLYYYSYYSFTIYLSHNLLFFLLTEQLNIFTVWLAISITTVLLGAFLNIAHKKLKRKLSLKAIIGQISYLLAKKIAIKSEYKFNKIGAINPSNP